MKQYLQDIFYDNNNLSFDDKLALVREAKDMCYQWHADRIVGTQRRNYNPQPDFENYLKNFNEDNLLFRFIYRRGWPDNDYQRWNLEIVLNNGLAGQFLWINVDQEKLDYFIEKYKLTK